MLILEVLELRANKTTIPQYQIQERFSIEYHKHKASIKWFFRLRQHQSENVRNALQLSSFQHTTFMSASEVLEMNYEFECDEIDAIIWRCFALCIVYA